METNSFEVKAEALAYAMFPQLPNFCAVAACCGALGAILQRPVTQQELHAHYQVGLYTKLKAPAECDPNTFANLQRSGKGFSNWDVIRLCNAVLLDNSRVPAAAILCGQDFVRETSVPERLDGIFDWLRSKTCQAIVHILGHYTLCAGTFASAANGDRFLLLADSAKRSGPLRSLRVAE
jgi:hypothetical protein